MRPCYGSAGLSRSRLVHIESCNVPAGPNYTFCFHDSEEVGPAALSKMGKDTGLRPEDL
jgi:hypothetical protein